MTAAAGKRSIPARVINLAPQAIQFLGNSNSGMSSWEFKGWESSVGECDGGWQKTNFIRFVPLMRFRRKINVSDARLDNEPHALDN